MKITIKQLKQIIKEELSKSVKEDYRDAADKSMADTVPHSWLNHGKLSSALQERYGISDDDLVGEVLWHSLNESGEVGIYDMKFGDTIIRNLTESDLEEADGSTHKRDKEHGEQDEKDPKRRKKSID